MSRRPNSPVGFLDHGFVTSYDTALDQDSMDLTKRLSINTGHPIPKLFIPPDDETIIDQGITCPKKKLRIGTGDHIPKKFVPPDDETTPQYLFPAGTKYLAIPPVERFIHRRTPSIFLVYTDGSCLGNGGRNPKAGCSIIFRPLENSKGDIIPDSFRFALENKGPQNDEHPQTSNRAELRAAIAACQFRAWTKEGFTTMVIATGSEYVVEGIMGWIRGWIRRDWKTTKGHLVKNRDLWDCLRHLGRSR
ncbi:ribonuclease H-like domain-containing protein [Penicillium malachiteum]|nr:ribonuclease H-like domain-containing protein [Penicillium malachiteum]